MQTTTTAYTIVLNRNKFILVFILARDWDCIQFIHHSLASLKPGQLDIINHVYFFSAEQRVSMALGLISLSSLSFCFQGLYAMAMNCMDNAISQFQTALSCCSDTHFWTFINLNLGIIYARTNKQTEFMALLQHIHPHQVPQE